MNSPNYSSANERVVGVAMVADERSSLQTQSSAVSWSAIVAGAAAAAALSLILLILGTGLGMSSVSPWAHNGISATTLGVSTILWLTLTQLVASGMGGYLAGRLRTKWVEVHTDEVYFRDTAHGFLAWAVASLMTAALLTSVIGSIVSGGIQAGAAVAGGVSTAATVGAVAAGTGMAKSDNDDGQMSYFVDSLFRKQANAASLAAPAESGAGTAQQQDIAPTAPAAATANNDRTSSEVARIFMTTLPTGPLPAEDVRYVGQLVAERTGVPQQEAEKRVNDTYARAQAKLRDTETAVRDAADKARKASAYTALWLFISLLIGAFVASLAATYGGRHRDD